jgi:asparagine synthase (glutamine-hydrolysing)
VPSAAATPAAAVARALPRAAAARRVAHLLGGRGDAQRLLRLVEITDTATRTALVGAGTEAEHERLATARGILADVPGHGLLGQALHLDTHMFLPDGILLCNDKMSMAAGLELRVPFLDLELMRFVERIPASRRVRPRQPKRLHRRAIRRLLPPEVTNRAKHGFSTPYDDWLRASLGREVEQRYAPGSPLADLIDLTAATRLVDEHRRGRADHKSILYCLLELSEWHAAFVEAREPVAA